MDDDQQFCLRWNNHQSTLISVFDNLLTSQTLVDCTIAAEGKFLKAHKVVLSACSPYFATLLQQQYDKHPILILKDVKYQELTAMMDYMYRGEVNISQDQLAALLKAAESLQIKGLSDNRTGAPKPEHHRGLNIPGSVGGGSSKLSSGYTLEQTKRARVGQSGMDSQDLSASREGSSSPSRRRRKVRRRSIENAMTDIHDNSNSSQMQSNQSALLQQPANLAGAGAITAAAAQIPTSSTALSTGTSVGATGATSGQGSTQQPMTTSVTKKTESVKGTSDAMKTENVQTSNIVGVDEQEIENLKGDKQNHKQKMTPSVATGKDTSDLVIEPKSEYDDDGNDETVEDLTLDDEEMGMDDLDHNAGTSQGGEGSSQGYAPWQHDRSQDELLLTTQDAQQRDPQDLSITRIAGLTWNEWNARLAMPLVTQLREGSQPIVFPTDLSINAMEKSQSSTAGSTGSLSGVGITERGTAKERTKSPNNRSDTPTNEISSESAAKTSTPLNCSANTTTGNSAEKGTNGTSKLKIFSEEEATMLMLKAAAEKSGTNNSGNISDNSYGDDNGNLSGGGGAGGDYHATISSAGAFADVGGAAGLCNINILNSISAMNSLIGGSGNGGVSIGAPGGAGHPCPECGRVYKLKSSLRNHQKWECGKEPQFQCPFCVYRAKQKMHIGRHMERMHKEKFIKLDDIKTFTSSGASVGGDDSSSATATAAAVLSTAAELRQHFS